LKKAIQRWFPISLTAIAQQWRIDRAFKTPQPVTRASFCADLEATFAAHKQWRQNLSVEGHPSAIEFSEFSQNGEDGILESVLDALDLSGGYFWELGAADGQENCTRNLAEQSGWNGLWIEGSVELASKAHEIGKELGVETVQSFITADNILDITAGKAKPNVLVIDIDGNDFWVWSALGKSVSPEVLMIETNNSFGPDSHWVMPYDDTHRWHQDRYYGASLRALTTLGKRMGYCLVANDSTGTNAIFVRSDLSVRFPLAGDRFAHFAPAIYRMPNGHPWPNSPEVNFDPLDVSQFAQLSFEDIEFSSWPELGYFVVIGEVHNQTDRWIPHVGAFPVHVGWSWGEEIGQAKRATLATAIAPGGRVPFAVIDRNPPKHVDQITLSIVQEDIGWAHLQGKQESHTFIL
jgi:hypothetical protein